MTLPDQPLAPAFRIPRLAIIDDGEFDRMLYARIIGRTGLVGETLSFCCAEDALVHFETPTPLPVDVILLDISMPGMSGLDFLDHIAAAKAQAYADVVIVMLTTSLHPKDVARAAQCALVRDYISKPLEEEHLHRIATLLAAIRSEAEAKG